MRSVIDVTSTATMKTVLSTIWAKAGGKYALIVIGAWLLVSALSLVWTPYSLLDTNGFNAWASPSAAHPLGADGTGADVLSWLMAGSRTNLMIAVLTVIVFYMTIGAGIAILFYQGAQFAADLFRQVPALYQEYIQPLLQTLSASLQEIISFLPFDDFSDVFAQLSASLDSVVSSVSSDLVSLLGQVTVGLPSFVVSFIFAIISSFFIAMDYGKITRFLLLQLNEKQQQVVMTTRYFIKDTILQFLIGYGKIMCITFVELCIGLSVLGVDNSIIISFLIALFDVLPVFGTGGIMIPWIIISLLMQDIKLAVGLTIVYLIITLIRNIIEPRIVGEQIGLHPLLMLLSMYLGIRFFGFLGLFLLPATLLLIKELNEKGILHIYKTEKEGPPA